MDAVDTIVAWIVGLVVAGWLAIGGWLVYDTFAHPCLKYQTYACTRSRCTAFVPIVMGKSVGMACISYENYEGTCTTCTERK